MVDEVIQGGQGWVAVKGSRRRRRQEDVGWSRKRESMEELEFKLVCNYSLTL